MRRVLFSATLLFGAVIPASQSFGRLPVFSRLAATSAGRTDDGQTIISAPMQAAVRQTGRPPAPLGNTLADSVSRDFA